MHYQSKKISGVRLFALVVFPVQEPLGWDRRRLPHRGDRLSKQLRGFLIPAEKTQVTGDLTG